MIDSIDQLQFEFDLRRYRSIFKDRPILICNGAVRHGKFCPKALGYELSERRSFTDRQLHSALNRGKLLAIQMGKGYMCLDFDFPTKKEASEWKSENNQLLERLHTVVIGTPHGFHLVFKSRKSRNEQCKLLAELLRSFPLKNLETLQRQYGYSVVPPSKGYQFLTDSCVVRSL